MNTTLDIITIIISLIALVASVYVGIKQVKISQTQMDFQNKVELYMSIDNLIYRDVNQEVPDKVLPAICIRNIGGNVVYLEKYTFNGKEYPLNKFVLPPVVTYDAFRYINLPTNGETHVSLKLYFLIGKI